MITHVDHRSEAWPFGPGCTDHRRPDTGNPRKKEPIVHSRTSTADRGTHARPWWAVPLASLLLAAAGAAGVAPGAAAEPETDDPWSPEPVTGELFDMTSQGWKGDVPVGTSTATTMTITAHQDLRLEPDNWAPGGDNHTFALAGTCPTSRFDSVRMAPGETCTVTWTIHPTVLTTTSTSWTFSGTPLDANGAESGDRVVGQHNLEFSSFAFEAEAVDFGSVPVGTSHPRPVTFRNVSAVDATILVEHPWDLSMVFEGLPVDPVLVPPGASVTLEAVYSPADVGETVSEAWFWSALPGSSRGASGSVALAGTGIEATAPPVDPDPVDPPVDPSEPPVFPVDPPVEPAGPGDPSVSPVEVPPEPTGPVTPVAPASEEAEPRADVAPAAVDRNGVPAAQVGPVTGVLAMTGGQWLTLVLGALALIGAGAASCLWGQLRPSLRDDEHLR